MVSLRVRALGAAMAALCALFLSAGALAEEPGSAVQELLNGETLSPAEMQSGALNELVSDRLGTLLSSDMTTYEQVKTCYDFLLENMQYDSSMRHLDAPAGDGTCWDIFYSYGELEGFAAVALSAHYGQCNGYAAAFIAMTRSIGLDARLVKGSTRGAGGGYVPHQWAELSLGGVPYIFDPQLDQNLAAQGLGEYGCFCLSYEDAGGRYLKGG